MGAFTRSFKKIIPSIRQSTMDVIAGQKLKGERRLIPGRDGDVEIFVHPAGRDHAPVLFEFHGGGLVLGDARKDDNLREIIKEALDIHVIGVNYRKAPEYPHPAAVNDAYDAVKYVAEHPEEFHADPDRLAVLGFSAGATLAAVTAIRAAGKKEFSLCGQILHYPYLDGVSEPLSKKNHPADLPVEVMEAFIELYAGNEDKKDPEISPLYAGKELLTGAAPAVLVMAGEDALCEEGCAYAEHLVEAGVDTRTYIMEEMHHGYMEDYYNQACYEINPEDTRKLHSPRMQEQAKRSMEYTLEALKKFFNGETVYEALGEE